MIPTLVLLALLQAPVAQPAPEAPSAAALAPAEQRLVDEALEAVLAGDLARAQLLLSRAELEATTPQGRALLALLGERVKALAGRQSVPAKPPTLTPPAASQRPSSGARAMVLVSTTGLGLAAWGWMLPTALHLENSVSNRGFLGLYMLTAASSFAGPFFWTRTHPPDFGEANLAYLGGTRGLLYGFLAGMLFTQGNQSLEHDEQEQIEAIGSLIGSVGGMVGASLWASRSDMTPGQARTVGVMADLGVVTGLLSGLIIMGEDREGDGDRLPPALGLAGAALGVTGGRFLSLRRDNTWGDGEVMRAAGLYGALLGATTGMVADLPSGHWRAMIGVVLGGTALGHAGGDLLVRRTDISVPAAILVDLSLLSGALAGAGLFHLITSGEPEEGYLVSASLGGGLAAGLAFYSLRDWGGSDEARRAAGLPQVAVVPMLPLGGSHTPGASGLAVAGRF